ncbi:MAG: SufE family protein [Cephaloticoccus sp.]|nr:SufE family protein [Cephaloticoccus sp.]MCF7759116.1 SufE family protein [Cephaloticoccus sp.]
MTDRQREFIDDLNIIEDPQERLTIVVDRARRHPALLDTLRTDAHRVPGCISQVWLVSEFRDGHCHFRCDADGPLVKGLVALLCDFYSAATPAEIRAADSDPLTELGLLRNLSPTRQNGLAAVRAAIRTFAQDHAAT